jgi:hypothetical protein
MAGLRVYYTFSSFISSSTPRVYPVGFYLKPGLRRGRDDDAAHDRDPCDLGPYGASGYRHLLFLGV